MTKLINPMQILKLLDGSNCGKCGEAGCLAFAASVFRGQKKLGQCPTLPAEVFEQYGESVEKRVPVDQDFRAAVDALKQRIRDVDLQAAAARIGAEFADGRLTLQVMGKDFRVDTCGNLSSDIHINPWVSFPILDHIISGSGTPPSGRWVPFRELPNGKTWQPLFGQRCEKPMKQVADNYTDLFEDMIRIFNGKQVENHYKSDISIVLRPLPRFPTLICYWKPDGPLESDLHLFFDANAEDNLGIHSIYALGTGMVSMFEKIAARHAR